VELTVGGWISTFVKEVLDVEAGNALIILSLYWLGMMLTAHRGRKHSQASIAHRRAVRPAGDCARWRGSPADHAQRRDRRRLEFFSSVLGSRRCFRQVLGFIAGSLCDALREQRSVWRLRSRLPAECPCLSWPGILGGVYGMRGSFLIVPVALVMQGLLLGVLAGRLRNA
jgi:uncharacterized membrane protein YfcA